MKRTLLALFYAAVASCTALFAAQARSDSVVTKPIAGAEKAADSLAAPTATDTARKAPASDSTQARAGDSTNSAAPDTAKAKVRAAASAAAAPPPEDTLYHFWNRPYWGIGAGWGLGAFPLFAQWQKGLPDSAADLVGKNSQIPRLTVAQAVDAYYIVWPLLLSVTPFTREQSCLTVESSWYFLFSSKSFIATLKNDSLPVQSVTWNQSCAAYYVTVGLSYRRAIPEEYFKVEGVQRTAIVLGLSITPLLRVASSASFSPTGIADSTRLALQSHRANKVWNGTGCAWKLGISTLKKLSSRSGLQMDLVYIGRWNGVFNPSMRWKDINPSSDTPDKNVSFLSTTFEINISLLTGKRPPKP